MSLHIGHLSPHVRQEDLEKAFGRFGPCTLSLKEGYGFVVYDVSTDAEQALRALRGRIVCGENISLNWSNIQPRPLDRSVTDSRLYAPHHRRSGVPKTQEQKGTPVETDQGYEDERSGDAKDGKENSGEFIKDEMRGEGHMSDHGGSEDDQWLETGIGQTDHDFDRYEPYRDHNGLEENETFQHSGSLSSSDWRYSSGMKRRERYFDHDIGGSFNRPRPLPVCYSCGDIGHIARNCPNVEMIPREDLQWFRDDRSFREPRELRFTRFRSDPWRRPTYNHVPPFHIEDAYHERSRNFPKAVEIYRSGQERIDERSSKRALRVKSKRHTQRRGSSSPLCSSRSRSVSAASSPSYSGKSTSSRIHSHSRGVASASRNRSAKFASSTRSKRPKSRSRSRSKSNSSCPISLSVSISPHKEICLKESAEADVQNGKLNEPKHLECVGAVIAPAASPVAMEYQTDEEELMRDIDSQLTYVEKYGTRLVKKRIGCYEDHGKAEDKSRSERRNSLKLSSKEVFLTLKHYGTETPDEPKDGVSVEEYLGAARLWPWEIIHYRRLKKGPISTENYRRRLEQNREYDIDDKYVRSSSGWWEADSKV